MAQSIKTGTHKLFGVSPRGDKRCVVFSVQSEALVFVTEHEQTTSGWWVRVRRVEEVRAQLARRWYREYLQRGYAAA